MNQLHSNLLGEIVLFNTDWNGDDYDSDDHDSDDEVVFDSKGEIIGIFFSEACCYVVILELSTMEIYERHITNVKLKKRPFAPPKTKIRKSDLLDLSEDENG